MTYEEYIQEQETAFAEEHSDECCFVDNQAEAYLYADIKDE
jgi:hypothetical protein